MSIGINTQYGKVARPILPVGGAGKTFHVVSSAAAYVGEFFDYYKPDEDGVPRAYTDLATALAAVVSGRGDTIYVDPGTYTLTSGLSSSRSGFKIVGNGPPGSVVIAGSVDLLTLTGDNIELRNLQFQNAATFSGLVLTGVDNLLVKDCNFLHSGAGGAGTYGVEMVTTANTNVVFDGCRLTANCDVSGGAVTVTALALGLGSKHLWNNCLFESRRQTTANAAAVTAGLVYAAAADWGDYVKGCTFVEHNGATFTAGLNYGTGVTTGGVFPTNCNFLLATAANAIVNGSNAEGFACNIANETV